MVKTEAKSKLARWLPYILIVGGIIGIICSLVLTHDQIQIWKNPSYVPNCSLNPIVSCGSVIDSGKGSILAIPGPIFGLLAFPVLVAVGAAILAGARFKRWFWLGLQAGVVGGVLFAIWLFVLSVFQVKALCPFCLTVDVVVFTVAWYVTLYNIEQRVIRLPKVLVGAGQFARRHHLDILVLFFLSVIAFILYRFWYYFGNHLPF